MKPKMHLLRPAPLINKNPAAVSLGKLGGSANTPAQNKARALNGKKGGRPRKESKTP